MLPGHLVAEFWADVRELLQKQYGFSEEQARDGIADYRARLDARRVDDMVYHRDPPAIADTIAGALRQGGFQ
jgi:hypothetical protein